MLILDPHGSYQFFWPDSSSGYLLARGEFSVRDDLNADGRPSGELRISFAPSFDSKRHSFKSVQAARVQADTIALVERAAVSPSSNLTRRFVRERAFTGKVPAPRIEKVVTHVSRAGDSLAIPPASATLGPYEDPAVPVAVYEPATARWLRGNNLGGDLLVKALVATDGRVRKVEPVGVDLEKNQALMATVRRWVLKPALMSGRPVATWVEIPFQSTH